MSQTLLEYIKDFFLNFKKIKELPCSCGIHHYVDIIPENFNIYHEFIPCECGLMFQGVAHIKFHLAFDAPKCKWNRVCINCEMVDLRLDNELEKIKNIIKENDEMSHAEKANKILKHYYEEAKAKHNR